MKAYARSATNRREAASLHRYGRMIPRHGRSASNGLRWAAILLATATLGVHAAEPAARYETIHVVQRGANTGRPLVFLPPLGFPGSVYDAVAREFEQDHPIYLVTYCGTEGIPAPAPPLLSKTIEDVARLLREKNLDRPVLVGHLLGAHIAIHVAARHPDRVGGLAIAPQMARRPPKEARRQVADMLSVQLRETADDMWKPLLLANVRDNCNDEKLAASLSEQILRVDRGAYTAYLTDQVADPIEDELPKIAVPALMIAPFGRPPPTQTDEFKDMRPSEYARWIEGELAEMYPGVRRCDIESVKQSNNFPMQEQPIRVVRILRQYLRKLADPDSKWESTIPKERAVHGANDPQTPPAGGS
ncbi:MAG: alpha/beta hydrolase [Phycisphaerae bacterium]|nr:alpha/beta hydrolase [Phycisphaerae bacterium]